MENGSPKSNGQRGESPAWLEVVREQVGSVHYGAVQIIIHGSRVVQVETTERLRFDPASDAHPASSESHRKV